MNIILPRKLIKKTHSVGWSLSLFSISGFGSINNVRLIESCLDGNTVKTTEKTSKPYFRMNEKY